MAGGVSDEIPMAAAQPPVIAPFALFVATQFPAELDTVPEPLRSGVTVTISANAGALEHAITTTLAHTASIAARSLETRW